MRLLINVEFNIYKPSMEEIEVLKSCSVWFKEINDECITIIVQKITLESNDMEEILDIFDVNGATIDLWRYETGRYEFKGKGVDI